MTNHTPTPWEAVVHAQEIAHSIYGPEQAEGVPRVARMLTASDAALIVRAVNAFEPMREALRYLLDGPTHEQPQAIEAARAALKLAEES